MWEIRILTVGKTKNRSIKEEIERLADKVKDEWKVSINSISLADSSIPSIKAKKESEEIILNLPKDSLHFFLDPCGKEYDSDSFYKLLKKEKDLGRKVSFAVGGAYGFDKNILKDKGDFISLSKMTFSHELSLLMLIEQIYRAYTLYKNIPYSK